ncbi:MAG: hypothetical protein ACI4J0_10145 [Huintestinicola sp.]|uniref:hypothetical protein n=1 Tax=Huintestinicola sp. TaxID=2981661 RepID=UPI003F114629
MKKNVLFFAGAAASSLALVLIVCIFSADVIISVRPLTSNGAALILSSAAFALADVISAVFCLTGKMKDDKSVVYSITRLFIIVYALNMRDKSAWFLVIAGLNVIMYALSLFKDFRKFAARNSGSEVSE